MISYISIVISIMKITTASGRSKAFQHLCFPSDSSHSLLCFWYVCLFEFQHWWCLQLWQICIQSSIRWWFPCWILWFTVENKRNQRCLEEVAKRTVLLRPQTEISDRFVLLEWPTLTLNNIYMNGLQSSFCLWQRLNLTQIIWQNGPETESDYTNTVSLSPTRPIVFILYVEWPHYLLIY